MRFMLALKLFFRTLLDATAATRLERAMNGVELPAAAQQKPTIETKASAPQAPATNEAVMLLATLQREARFVDLVKESLTNYTDAQVGATARDVLRDCAGVLERLFGLQPLTDQQEGSELEVPPGYSPLRMRLTGKVTGQPPFRGTVIHPGWRVTRNDMPSRANQDDAGDIVAPIEVELRG